MTAPTPHLDGENLHIPTRLALEVTQKTGAYGLAVYTSILRLEGEPSPLSIRTIADKANVSRPTATKYARTLVELGFVAADRVAGVAK